MCYLKACLRLTITSFSQPLDIHCFRDLKWQNNSRSHNGHVQEENEQNFSLLFFRPVLFVQHSPWLDEENKRCSQEEIGNTRESSCWFIKWANFLPPFPKGKFWSCSQNGHLAELMVKVKESAFLCTSKDNSGQLRVFFKGRFKWCITRISNHHC